MTQDIFYRGFVVKLSDDLPVHRQASYQIVSSPDGSTGLPVLVECGSFEDLALIVKRIIDRRLRGDEPAESYAIGVDPAYVDEEMKGQQHGPTAETEEDKKPEA